jgi:Tfp pilus assembly protein PilF
MNVDIYQEAIRCLEARNYAMAEQYFWAVLASYPNHAESLRYLGLLARQRGDLNQAIDYFNRSLIADSSSAKAWANLADARLDSGEYHKSIPNYEEALRHDPDQYEVHNNMGVALQNIGEIGKSVDCFRRATEIKPERDELYNNLGNALAKLGQHEEAVTAYREGMRLNPQRAELAYNLGTSLHKQGEIDQAIDYYRQALRLRPNYPDASNNLATALKENGALDDAIAQYRETLQLLPLHALAHYNLSELVATGRYSFPPQEIATVKDFLASGQCPSLARSLFCFTLATVHHTQGEYDQAFGYYREANELRKQDLVQAKRNFDAAKHRAGIANIMAMYDRAYFEKVQTWGLDTEAPVFIVGMPRSGSTLVEQILASHPRVFGAGELGHIPRFVSELTAKSQGAMYAEPVLADKDAARNLATTYLASIKGLGKDAARVTIKTLENFLHLGVIATLFPNARIIHCRRDPLDVCVSCYFQNFHDLEFSWDLEDIAAYYVSYVQLMAHWAKVLPLRVHHVDYEELVSDQEGASRALVEFCGLPWDDRCLAFHKTRRPVRTASTVQVRKPISAQAVGRWKHYREHLGPLFQALGLPGDLRCDTPIHYSTPDGMDGNRHAAYPVSSL